MMKHASVSSTDQGGGKRRGKLLLSKSVTNRAAVQCWGLGSYPGRCGVAPLSALLRIGGKRKPRATEACGASRTGNLGEGIGGRRFLSTYARQRPRAGLVPGASQQGQLGGCGQRSAGPGRREIGAARELTGRNVVIVIGHGAPYSHALWQVAVGRQPHPAAALL
jgi:hypothetical protein